MTEDELKKLSVGDAIIHIGDLGHHPHIVTGNYGGRVTAVHSVDVTNPIEWVVVRKVKTDYHEEDEYAG